MIHMTATQQSLSGQFFAYCRCKWASGPHDTRNQARTAGDEHLAQANSVEEEE